METLPENVKTCALYLGGDGSLGIAWEGGVCALMPMEAAMQSLSLAGKELILHDCKEVFHQLDDRGIGYGKCAFDTKLAAYDLNPSQSDYPVSKLATTFLGKTVEDEDVAGCAEALWHLRPLLTAELEKTGMDRLYQEIELPGHSH